MFRFKFLGSHNYFTRSHRLEHSGDFLFLHETASAKNTFERENIEVALLFLGAFAVLSTATTLLFGFLPLVVLFFSAALLFYFGSLLFKAFLVVVSVSHRLPSPSRTELMALTDHELPAYTILVPLYKEANVLFGFVRAMNRLDYPKEKLDIRLLLEADDAETIAAAKRLHLEKPFSIMFMPSAGPRTKPKALNVGILEGQGEILTIYDAEDRPDPLQLRSVVWTFRHSPDHVVCAQARLTFYNANQNLLTRWFFAEYHSWFNHFLPALFSLSLPIPLGGTSNHFKTSVLKDIGAWDPYNVTEDADLGMRLSRRGYTVTMVHSVSARSPRGEGALRATGPIAVIDSATREEANSMLFSWMRQRTRWLKGYLQTSLVHLRHPSSIVADLSWRGFLSFLFFMIGTPLGHLLNLLFWVITALWLLNIFVVLPSGIPPALLLAGMVSLLFGNLLFVLLHAVPMALQRNWRMTLAALFIPFYWLLMSLATVRAVWQLFFNPHYWEKTPHGLIRLDRRRIKRGN